ncbi:MAG: type II CAAX endopeptidase family protein [Candidatus Omnitrophota bacterium]|nr:CPBP family intramembrane metalloprotease [bacterium]
MNKSELYPNFKQSLWLLFLVLVLQISCGIIIGIASIIFKSAFLENSIVAGFTNLISFGLILLFVHNKTKQKWAEILQLTSFRYNIILPLFPLLIGLGIIASETDNLLRYILPAPEFINRLMTSIVTSGFSSIILVGIIAPLTEEFLFRGVILKGLASRYSPRKAVIYSAIMFSLFHLNPYQFFASLALGLLMGFLYLKTHSIIPCIIAHSIFNVHAIIITSLLKINISGYSLPGTYQKVQFQPMWFDLLGAALLLIGFLLLWKSLKSTSVNAEQTNTVDS